MINLKLVSIITFLLLFTSTFSFSQADSTQVKTKEKTEAIVEESEQEKVEDEQIPTLREQFYELKNKSNSWKDYKVIKNDKLVAFWQTVEDSIDIKEKTILDLSATIEVKDVEIKELKTSLSAAKEEIKNIQFDIRHIKTLGITMDKSSYVLISWSVIIILILLLLISIVRTKQSIKISKTKKNDFDELSEEFEAYKKRVMERETKLKRELTTELNKVEELKQKLRKI